MKKNKKVLIIFIILGIALLSIGVYFAYTIINENNNGNKKYLSIDLKGDKEVILKWKDKTYTDEGAIAKYKDEDISKNIEVTNNVDYEKVGEYKYTYTIKYKKVKKTIERKVKIIDDVKPELKLNGPDNNFLILGNEYKDYGATATDNYDGDITKNIEVDTSQLNKDKLGKYKVIYKVKDSSGNENTLERNIEVKKKSSADQKVAVLNYHYLYKDKTDFKEKCDSQEICFPVDRFKEQLKYLEDNGFTTLTIHEFVQWMYGEIDIPEKSVLLTFDDGGWGTATDRGNFLIPSLEEYKAHATLFLIVGFWDKALYESPYLDLQSHTYALHYEAKCGHRSKVNCVSYEELVSDLKRSAYVLGSKDSFCFPYYDYTEESIKAVKEVGFRVAFIGAQRKASRSNDKYKIPRYTIYNSTSMESFKQMVN